MKLNEDCQKELAHLQAEVKLRDGQAWAYDSTAMASKTESV